MAAAIGIPRQCLEAAIRLAQSRDRHERSAGNRGMTFVRRTQLLLPLNASAGDYDGTMFVGVRV